MKALLALVSLLLASAVSAQDAKLIAEGKKEGKVVIYGSMESDIFDGVQRGFEKKIVIKVGSWRADADKIQIVEMDEPDANQMAVKRKEYRKIFQ
ncbi:MAG TPA: hypothetical protein VF208_09920 [Candidatus Binatia bacterium]